MLIHGIRCVVCFFLRVPCGPVQQGVPKKKKKKKKKKSKKKKKKGAGDELYRVPRACANAPSTEIPCQQPGAQMETHDVCF